MQTSSSFVCRRFRFARIRNNEKKKNDNVGTQKGRERKYNAKTTFTASSSFSSTTIVNETNGTHGNRPKALCRTFPCRENHYPRSDRWAVGEKKFRGGTVNNRLAGDTCNLTFLRRTRGIRTRSSLLVDCFWLSANVIGRISNEKPEFRLEWKVRHIPTGRSNVTTIFTSSSSLFTFTRLENTGKRPSKKRITTDHIFSFPFYFYAYKKHFQLLGPRNKWRFLSMVMLIQDTYFHKLFLFFQIWRCIFLFNCKTNESKSI